MRHILCVATLLFVCVTLAAAGPEPLVVPGDGHVPPPAYNFPPVTRAARRVVWLGPYTSSDWVQVGQHRQVTVRWYSPDGKVIREIVQPGAQQMFGDYVEKGKELYAANGTWHFTPAARKWVGATISTSPDAYLLSYSATEGLVRGDLYWHGKLTASVGPYYQYEANDSFDLGLDGSLSIIAWDGLDKKTPQIIVLTKAGEVRVRADCDPSIGSSIVAPAARGAIAVSWSGDGRHTFFGSDGRRVPLPGRRDLGFRLWIPDSVRALLGVGRGGFGADYELVDCDTGAVLWHLELPHPEQVGPLGVAGPYIIFGGIEFSDTLGGPPGDVRTLYAVDTATGRIAAHWLPASSYAGGWGDYALRLLPRDGTYYLLSDGEFSALNLEDIRAKRNGWQ